MILFPQSRNENKVKNREKQLHKHRWWPRVELEQFQINHAMYVRVTSKHRLDKIRLQRQK